jgi:hypothetical protein
MSAKKTKSKRTGDTRAASVKAKAAGATSMVQAKKTRSKLPASERENTRLSALDAAAQVLARSAQPMRAQDLITAMAKRGLWQSPRGKTPHATLCAAMLREIAEKGKEARFQKVERGMFATRVKKGV